MCGIFGIVARHNSNKSTDHFSLLNSLFIYSESRGMEASGVVVKNGCRKKIEVLRKDIRSAEFIKLPQYKTMINQALNPANDNFFSIVGHTRIATNGSLQLDNQPIEKNGCLGVHNGIVCNVEELWDVYKKLGREQEIDSELLFAMLKSKLDEGQNPDSVMRQIFSEIEGTASFAATFFDYNSTIISTNCGSLYYYYTDNLFVFASEHYILQQALTISEVAFEEDKITQILPGQFLLINERTFEVSGCLGAAGSDLYPEKSTEKYTIHDISDQSLHTVHINQYSIAKIKSFLEYDRNRLEKIKRCSRCILPETHPFIDFDQEGVCNYCREYEKRLKRKPKGKDQLFALVDDWKKKEGNNCIVMLSGGRDSCYALHVVKEELGLNPVAYSYDWGMLTDLGRRNQSRMCAKLGVEHILVSADIKNKRRFVRLNVEAFLSKPNLGTIGLFMAGDKAYHHFAAELQNRTGLPLINGGCPFEWTYFKEGFAGVKPSFMKKSKMDKLQIVKFFLSQAIKNPKYFNASVWDNLLAYWYYYGTALKVTNLFHYLDWNENNVNSVLIDQYNWEVAEDTTTTWRIGDGTASFYNYIYCTVAGFTENDCLRSNQILEGVITREEALNLALDENKPRHDGLHWYCNTIGIDIIEAARIINSIPKLY